MQSQYTGEVGKFAVKFHDDIVIKNHRNLVVFTELFKNNMFKLTFFETECSVLICDCDILISFIF